MPSVWTAADQAELDVLLWTLADAYFTHREECDACLSRHELGSLPCPHVRDAVETITDWHHHRALASRAAHLRALQDAA